MTLTNTQFAKHFGRGLFDGVIATYNGRYKIHLSVSLVMTSK